MFPAGRAEVEVRYVRLPSGLSLRVLECGGANADPILLLHGWGASVYMWRDWFTALATAGRRVIAVDLPGHGLSDKPDGAETNTLAGMAAAVREFMRAESLSDVDVVAQSMAGTISVEIAAVAPDQIRRLVLINPACLGRVRIQRLARMVSPPVVDRVLPKLVPRWLIARTHKMVYGDPSRVTRRDEDEYWAPSQFPGFTRAMRQLVHEFTWTRAPASEMAERLRAMESRILVVLGSKDTLVRDAAEYVADLHAAGFTPRVETIVGGGHAVNEERPDEVIALLANFFADSQGASS